MTDPYVQHQNNLKQSLAALLGDMLSVDQDAEAAVETRIRT